MGERVFEKLDQPEWLTKSPILVFAGDAQAAAGLRGLGEIGRGPNRHYRTRPDFLQLCRELCQDGHIDGCLLTPADAETLVVEEHFFDTTDVTPLVRTNAETMIWNPRHGAYRYQASRPFTTVPATDAGFCRERICEARDFNVHLGLYSITLNNDVDLDHRTLESYLVFAKEVGRVPGFDHFLEVFPPNLPTSGMSLEETGEYVADSIMRVMSYLRRHERPRFIKTFFTTAEIWQELVRFDPSLIIGAMGGPREDAQRTLELAHNVVVNGGQVILFGRAIYQDDDPLLITRALRAVLDGGDPLNAYEAYREKLRRQAG